ncbi:alpha/beta fold hydrolase [Micromonospora sp. CA-111912]|uniref:alpha/beta fold hydrolase n=1 Tax=Micromonospora sp. CA-111912 TaxID=3239955 RepID=UPI003D89CDEE
MRYFVGPGEDRTLDEEMRRELRGSFVPLTDGTTHYELSGPTDGELAVLVGGLTIPLFYWDDVASRLHADGLRTLTYSAYGRGYSDRVHATYGEALFVRQLAELMATLGLKHPHHVVGTSMGTLIAMAYTGRQAASVSTLTVLGPAGLTRRPPPQQLLRSGLVADFVARRFGRRLLEGHLRHNVRDPEQAAALAAMVLDAYRYEGSLYALFSTLQNFPLYSRHELFRRTGNLGVPTMLIWGADDQVTPIAHIDTARALLQPRRTHVITECGHMAPLERPRDVADLLASFAVSQNDWRQP